ncbi:F-box protein family-like [Rhynchospora pubera]|uniref:F-box protein family-like n=1 Tax=Rhynchospora pubera TaxID=906938 RepID=A0AAV8CKK4_9POAL|nr:F-box protein family-like [Rhynchospora pubera]
MAGEMVGCKDENSLPHSFGSRPWLFVMHGSKKKTCTFYDPINNSMEERILPEFLQGKACLGCYGEWILLSDELTRECFFLNTISFSKIYIPPPPDSPDFIDASVSISSPPDTSNCVVVLICASKTFLLVFSLGTTGWNMVPINYLNNNMSSLRCASVIHNERLFIMTSMDETLAIDFASLAKGRMEMTVINRLRLCPSSYSWFNYLVKCAGDLFSIALHSYGRGHWITHVEVRRLELPSKECNEMHWRRVQDIGDHAFFLAGKYGGSLPANLALGAQCNCIYFPLNCSDGMRLYKFCLDDQILNYTFLPENDGGLDRLLWAFPTNIMQTVEEDSLNSSGVAGSEETDSTIIGKDDENKMVISRRWDELQIDLLELLLPRLSLVDCLQFASVCKEWSYASSSVQKGKVWPWLMHLPNLKYGSCKFFDPFYCKEYTLKSDALDAQDHLALRFSKGGWVVITEGNHRVFILNPFTAQVINLPSLDNYIFNGISFMSLPASPDFVVYGFFFQMYGEYVVISSWRPGEEEWVSHEFRSSSPFFPSSNNPVLFQGEFYCLGRKGELGVFNPEMESWNVLCKPEPVHLAVPWYGDEYCHLLELNGELISVFREDDIKKPIHLFKLNQSEMVWKKVEHLGDMTLFVDRRNSIAISPLEKKYVNRIYIPKFEGNRDSKKVIFYSMEDNRYHPCVQTHTVEEPVKCVWMEPNLHLHN